MNCHKDQPMNSRNVKPFFLILLMMSIFSLSYAKRIPPDNVPPVIYQGVKYVVIPWGYNENNPNQNGGYIEARDEKTDEKLWGLRVYDVYYNDNLERDAQDVFITSLSLDDRNQCLVIQDERGKIYYVDIAKRRVIEPPTGEQQKQD